MRGSACFGDDIVLPQALHVVFVRSAHAHAQILSIDANAARQQPGVVAVISAMELGSHLMPAINPLLASLEPYEFAVLPRDAVHY
ncbi:MAG: xanthine dehydrogenase family protein molybdopterin-binding subunit, partial [Betaproteobacteria bacterium]